eukprot:1096856-Amphidinium_carterae.1
MEKWEQLIKRYDDETVGPGEELQGKVKKATLIARLAKGALQDRLLVNMSNFTQYEAMRREVTAVLRAQRHMPGGVAAAGGASSNGRKNGVFVWNVEVPALGGKRPPDRV